MAESVLVTGGAGYIGVVTSQLLEKGHEVIVCANLGAALIPQVTQKERRTGTDL
jgi:UDP-glucose 4-epimerase